MKKYDLVILKQMDESLDSRALYPGISGFVLGEEDGVPIVLFLNGENEGDYVVCLMNPENLIAAGESLPEQLRPEFDAFIAADREKLFQKEELNRVPFRNGERVELIADRPRYRKEGLRVGDRGAVAVFPAVKDELLIDFSRTDENGRYEERMVGVKISDLVKLN